MQAVYAIKALKYMTLPGIAPRVTRLFASGFGPLAFFVARIYAIAGLLPPTHPYLNPRNMGRFGLRNVITEAASRLVFSRRHIDQFIIFGAVLIGIFLLAAQFILLGYTMLVGQAHAQISSLFTGSIFDTPNPTDDIALGMLDRVFGVPGMFCNAAGTCTTVNASLPTPMHVGLHDLFEFYSYAMLLVGVLIFLYFVVVVVMETAVSGHPFGQRFQNIWVPIRLVFALGLLVPLNYGYNAGQYMAFYSAKMGSALATNGWLRFNSVISSKMKNDANPSGETKEAMVGVPKAPSMGGLALAMSLVHTCAYGEWLQASRTYRETGYDTSNLFIKPYFIKNTQSGYGNTSPVQEVSSGTTFNTALEFYNNADIVIRFGIKDAIRYKSEPGNIGPVCGEIRIPVSSVANKDNIDGTGGAIYITRAYYNMVRDMWFNTGDEQDGGALKAGAVRFNEIEDIDPEGKEERACAATATGLTATNPACYQQRPTSQWKQSIVTNYQAVIAPEVQKAWQTYVAYKQDFQINQDILKFGWGGASIWYNKIAEVNGAFQTAVINVPLMAKYPTLMDKVLESNTQANANPTNTTMFTPNLSQSNGGASCEALLGDSDCAKAKALGETYKVWAEGGTDQTTNDKNMSADIFRNAMVFILGIDGVFKIRGENASIHPLAQLSMIGKGMVEHTIRNMAISNATAFMGGLASVTGQGTGAALLNMVGGLFTTTAFLGLTAGITLYYVLPFLPFIYFFFAVGAWVKSVFEAMVGIPLWALAHLRLDGEGLPGDAASSGYFLILEIGLRPILIVFGLIAAIMIFTAQVRILNYIWEMVTANAAGFSQNASFSVNVGNDTSYSFKRDVAEQFGHTVIYVIIVYMLANSSFKLIDMIPNEALRWLGGGASSFAAQDPNMASQLSSYVATAGMAQGQQLSGAVQGFSRGAGELVGSAGNELGGAMGGLANALTGRRT